MPLLKTILDYLKEKGQIRIASGPFSAYISRDGVINLNSSVKFNEGYGGRYWNLLHEFIHLDRKRTTGNYDGYEIPSSIEESIEREVEEIINQNCMAYRFLKKQLRRGIIITEQSGADFFAESDDMQNKNGDSIKSSVDKRDIYYFRHMRKKRGLKRYEELWNQLDHIRWSREATSKDEEDSSKLYDLLRCLYTRKKNY